MHTDDLSGLERLLALCEMQTVRTGVPLPPGAHARGDGVNFAIFGRNATGVRLDLFGRADDALPTRTIILDASRNKTGDIWHVWLEGIRPGQLYGFRMAGPYQPDAGHRFNPNKLVVDPYAGAIALVPGRDFRSAAGAHILEFKEMVRALHAAGIEVILDVVFNHTVEGSELGPTVVFAASTTRSITGSTTTGATTATSPEQDTRSTRPTRSCAI